MNSPYYTATPRVSSSQYSYGATDPLQRELITSYDESVELGVESLRKLSLQELRALNDNPDRLTAFVKDSFLARPMVKTMMKCRENVKEEADENMKFGPQLEEMKQEVKERYDELQQLHNSYTDVNKIYLKLCEKYNPQNIAQGLLGSVSKVSPAQFCL